MDALESKPTISDTAETVGGELYGGMADALLDLYNNGTIPMADLQSWAQNGTLSEAALAGLAPRISHSAVASVAEIVE